MLQDSRKMFGLSKTAGLTIFSDCSINQNGPLAALMNEMKIFTSRN